MLILKPKSKDLLILGHPTLAGLKPVHPHLIVGNSVQLPTVWKRYFFQNQPKIRGSSLTIFGSAGEEAPQET